MVNTPEQGRSLIRADRPFHLYMSPELGDPQLALLRIVWSAYLDILLVDHAYAGVPQVDLLFAGHAHECDDCSIRQAHLQQGKRAGTFVRAPHLRWLVANHDVPVAKYFGMHLIAFDQLRNDAHITSCCPCQNHSVFAAGAAHLLTGDLQDGAPDDLACLQATERFVGRFQRQHVVDHRPDSA